MEHKLIWSYIVKDELKFSQELKRKTYSTFLDLTFFIPTFLTSTPSTPISPIFLPSKSQKLKSTSLNSQKRLALAEKNLECQLPNSKILYKKV